LPYLQQVKFTFHRQDTLKAKNKQKY